MNQFWHSYPMLEAQLSEIQEVIVRTIRSAQPYLKEPMEYTLHLGGKMLRPAFVLIGSFFGDIKADKSVDDRVRVTAAAIETLHLATLIHDDIIDEAFLRRNKQTVQSKYSKEFAVYMGDYLLSQCFLMLADEEVQPRTLKYMAKGIKKVCTGEMTQNLFRYRNDITLLDYLGIIRGKTAALFAVSLGVGAYLTQAEEATAKKLAKIGLNIGMAFQIIDDLLDYSGDSAQVGKDLQTDLLKGYYTLPLILALHGEKQDKLRDVLSGQDLTQGDVDQVIGLVAESGALEAAGQIAVKYTEKALRLVEGLDICDGKHILADMIPKLLKRAF